MAADPLAAVLDLLTEHAEKIAALDAQAGQAAGATARVNELAALAQAMDRRIAELAARLDRLAPPGPGGEQDSAGDPARPAGPRPARPWRELTGPERDAAVGALRSWVDQVYRPGYGQLAATLGPCWEQHALCLYALDILAELWSVLYQAGARTPAVLSMQAEYQARILPALAEQMTTETSRCRHARDRLPGAARPRGMS